MSTNVYELVTARIIAQLEAGTVPWRCSWQLAANLISRKPYRGINRLLLGSCDAYSSPFWLTFKQALDLGGNVRKGEHGSIVVFWKVDAKAVNSAEGDGGDDGDGDQEQTPCARRRYLLRYYYVFNIEQCDNIPADKIPAAPSGADVDTAAKAIAAGYLEHGGPALVFGGARACYSPMLDRVQMPAREQFTGTAEYYSVLFHEFTHSTGHTSRLNREEVNKLAAFGEPEYAAE
jgi:antirestriction protein ArdC